jgi:AraC family transcriptional regulator of adaptative response/methylated-DNA-[protein]-cysteine methyltransferase
MLDFFDRPDAERQVSALRDALGRVIVPGDHPHLDSAADWLDGYFAGRRLVYDGPTLAPVGTTWQHLVWAKLRAIPPGETRSYSELATELGRPSARRALAMANSRNPLSVVVPCHRVIRSSGELSGYAGGPWRKQWLLDHERRYIGGSA